MEKPVVFLKLFIIVYIAILTLVLNVHTEEKLNLAVADFDGRNVSAVDALAVSDLLRIGLVNTNLFNIVNRSNMQQLLDEQKFQMTGCTSQDCAVKMGKMLNVQKMIVGSVIKLGEKYYITASAVDVETGRVVSSQKVESNSLEKLAEKAEELAVIMSEDISGKKVEKKIDLDTASMVISNLYKRPCISKILDKKNVMLNRGSADNIKVRELFKILDQKGVETIAKIRVTYTSFDESMAKILKIYKKKPEVGDLIRHYARRKVGGVGLMSGYIAGSLSNYSPAESFYYDYIHASGLGFQLSFGSAGLDVYEYSNINAIFTYDDRYNYAVYERKSIGFNEFFLYIFSVVIKYHYSYDSDISPYFGIGFSSYRKRYRYNSYTNRGGYNRWTGKYDPLGEKIYEWVNSVTTYEPFFDEEITGILPLFNIGLDLFANKFIHSTIDFKYFIGGSFRRSDTNLLSQTIGLSFNW